jgi:hypothetical protein
MELSEKVLVALIGFISGVAGSFIGPSVRWWIEKRRIQLEGRRNQIDEWEEMLKKLQKNYDSFEAFERDLQSKRRFPSLERSLGKPRVEQILRSQSDPRSAVRALKAAVAELQEEWGLI